uniref:Uncharacterized protein n=1 Tax=Kalanchoe fedtschenkoi TaxID=63787 RepID=A0A7N0UDE1_KALFE
MLPQAGKRKQGDEIHVLVLLSMEELGLYVEEAEVVVAVGVEVVVVAAVGVEVEVVVAVVVAAVGAEVGVVADRGVEKRTISRHNDNFTGGTPKLETRVDTADLNPAVRAMDLRSTSKHVVWRIPMFPLFPSPKHFRYGETLGV